MADNKVFFNVDFLNEIAGSDPRMLTRARQVLSNTETIAWFKKFIGQLEPIDTNNDQHVRKAAWLGDRLLSIGIPMLGFTSAKTVQDFDDANKMWTNNNLSHIFVNFNLQSVCKNHISSESAMGNTVEAILGLAVLEHGFEIGLQLVKMCVAAFVARAVKQTEAVQTANLNAWVANGRPTYHNNQDGNPTKKMSFSETVATHSAQPIRKFNKENNRYKPNSGFTKNIASFEAISLPESVKPDQFNIYDQIRVNEQKNLEKVVFEVNELPLQTAQQIADQLGLSKGDVSRYLYKYKDLLFSENAAVSPPEWKPIRFAFIEDPMNPTKADLSKAVARVMLNYNKTHGHITKMFSNH